MNKINCAIYVRKSTEKGLEQEFNSLHNQEEACKNYILSQSFNNWNYYKTYEDGGISGGTMKRPGLTSMLEDMKKGLIQTIVVYKVDRLSRSIIDFYNMMKVFEQYDCNFVSITQAFDTSNSMGKLTLNMLLSFAQFEREVSSERVRDKIAASKTKGLWTGGTPPLGYDIKDKKLIVNKKEAVRVKVLFEKYLEQGSIEKLREYTLANSIKSKSWTTLAGLRKGGRPFFKSMLARLLRDKVYIGKIEHKGNSTVYDGTHKGIISKELFNSAQKLLDENLNNDSELYNKEHYLLSNKITSSDGEVFKNQKSSKNAANKYRYYKLKGLYLPAGDIERITIETVIDFLNSDLATLLPESKILELKSVNFKALEIKMQHDLIKKLVDKIIYSENSLTLFLRVQNLSYLRKFQKNNYINTANNALRDKVYLSENKGHVIIEKEIFINDRVSTNRYEANGKNILTRSENSNHLIKALAYGWRYAQLYEKGKSINKIRLQEKKMDRTIYKYLNLAYLSPNIINDIMDSRAPSHITLQKLFHISSKYVDFLSQEEHFYN